MPLVATAAIFTGIIAGWATEPPPEDDDMRLVAQLTRLSNIVISDDTEFPFDAGAVDTDYCTWAGEGEPLVIVQTGWYLIGMDITTLGTGYGGANNSDYLFAVGRNGITLNDTIGAWRHEGDNSSSAMLDSGQTFAYLTAGDELWAYFQNQVVGATSLLVESNPSDGIPSGYLTDDGPGVLSPHLWLAKVASSLVSVY